MIQLRDYQVKAKEALRENIRRGNLRQCLCLPTGAGKTEVAMDIIASARALGKKAIFAADRQALIHQTSQRFYKNGIEHGVAMGESTFGRLNPIQVASQQTLEKRGYLPKVDLLIVDECHTQRKFLTDYIRSKPKDVTIIGLSATPFSKGLGDTYDGGVVNAITTLDLMDKGYLVTPTVYAATPIDTSGIKRTSTGEFEAKSAGEAATKIVGNIVDEWIKNTDKEFGGPVQTLGFAPTVAACEAICAQFRAAGYDFRTSSYNDKGDVSERIVNAFRNGEFIGLFSVDKFTKGFDVPQVQFLILARTLRKSLTGHIQMVGRVIRIHIKKTKAVINCHSGNWKGFYKPTIEFWEHGIDELPKGKATKEATRKEKPEVEPATCFECGIMLLPGQKNCPSCGKARPQKQDKTVYVSGKMEKQEAIKKGSREWRKHEQWVWTQMRIYMGEMMKEWGTPEEKARKYALAQFKQMYTKPGDEKPRWPDYAWGYSPIHNKFCDSRVRRAMRQQTNSYKKQQRKTWERKKPPETPQEAIIEKLEEEFGEGIVYRASEDEEGPC